MAKMHQNKFLLGTAPQHSPSELTALPETPT